ncbi:MAG: hypothetical protein QHC90_06835 [Shinella sp.]|jgi:uncharacterized protein with HEPN domain|nr:hypothetical protein [Shinella sp.]
MAREFRHAIDDILEAIAGIQTATADKTFENYTNDWCCATQSNPALR